MAARCAVQVAGLLIAHPKTFGSEITGWRALQLEWHLSKREILTLYLNRTHSAVRSRRSVRAAGLIFGKSPANLSYSEAAMLAVFCRAPSRLRQIIAEHAEAARNRVPQRMAVQGVWSREQVKE
ncbi:transglycosylase domain-containing protein [Shigella boydii]